MKAMTALTERMLPVAEKIRNEGPAVVTPLDGFDLAEAFVLLHREHVAAVHYIERAKAEARELARVMCL